MRWILRGYVFNACPTYLLDEKSSYCEKRSQAKNQPKIVIIIIYLL
jgi:hypothetical protein